MNFHTSFPGVVSPNRRLASGAIRLAAPGTRSETFLTLRSSGGAEEKLKLNVLGGLVDNGCACGGLLVEAVVLAEQQCKKGLTLSQRRDESKEGALPLAICTTPRFCAFCRFSPHPDTAGSRGSRSRTRFLWWLATTVPPLMTNPVLLPFLADGHTIIFKYHRKYS